MPVVQHQRRQHHAALARLLDGLHQHQMRALSRAGLHQPHALERQLLIVHPPGDLGQPVGLVDQEEAPAVLEQRRAAGDHRGKVGGDLVPRDGQRVVGVVQHAAALAVGRVAQHRVVHVVPQMRRCVLQIHLMHGNAPAQPVERRRPPRHIRAVGLDLHRVKRQPRVARAQQDGQDPRARAQIRDPRPGLQPRKVLQQHRVRAEPEPVRALDDAIALHLQIVQPLALAQPFQTLHHKPSPFVHKRPGVRPRFPSRKP